MRMENKESFFINVAGVIFSFELNGTDCKPLYVRLKGQYKGFISGKGKPHGKIVISYDGRYKIPALTYREDKTGLKAGVTKLIFKDRGLWVSFVNSITQYICKSVLASPETVLLHSASCAKRKKGYLFLGDSGSGKTTIAELSRGYRVLSDDKTLVKMIKNKSYLFNLPNFTYEYRRNQKPGNGPVNLKNIFLLKKDKFVKLNRAQKLGIQTISYQEFMQMIEKGTLG